MEHEAQEPTCEEIGWSTYETCSRCEYSTYEELPALGHDLVEHEAQEPTCEEIGWSAYETCSRCNYSTYEEIPALGHDLVEHEAQEPTREEIGWNAYVTCTRCDYSTYEEIPALGGDEPYTEPEYDLENPEWVWSEDYTSVNVIFHEIDGNEQTILSPTVQSSEVAATCETDGYTIYFAQLFFEGKEFSDERQDVHEGTAGHNYGEPTWEVSQEPTGGYVATATFVCLNDNSHTETVRDVSVEYTDTGLNLEATFNGTTYTKFMTYEEIRGGDEGSVSGGV